MTRLRVAPDTAEIAGQRPAVEVLGLSKHYGPVEAVRTVTFQVAPREVFAFLGPNGAGKSTTIRMLCTLTRPTAGQARVAGFDVARQPRAVRRSIGLVFQDQTLDEQLTAEENLRFHAVLYGVPRAQVAGRLDRVLELVDLTGRRSDLVSTYSGGMARRLEIARALLHTPDVLFLDEPTVGLDPQTRARMWEDVLRLRDEEGAAVFFTTHYMDEAEYADRIAIIDHGAVVALDTPAALKAAVGADTVYLRTADDATAAARLRAAGFEVTRAAPGGSGVSPGEHWLAVAVADGERAVGALVLAAGVTVERVRVHTPDLDDVFLHFTGRQIREQAADGQSIMRRFATASRRR
ncbi:MAG: ATP-binding cassette domain-containing protein [Actinomycetota bacterium]|nr:ATP-binding cassette domain-containing protein [Actinomycetota bacterium]